MFFIPFFHRFELEEGTFAFCPILLNLVKIARKFDDLVVVFSLLTFELSTELDVVVVAVVVNEVGGGGAVNDVNGVVVVDACSLSMRSFTSCK